MTNWRDHAACIGKGKLFYSDRRDDQTAAVAICAECPVIDACAADAAHRETANEKVFGVRAARRPRQRMRDNRGQRPHGPCGTEAGHTAHRRRQEPSCEPCKIAANNAARARRMKADR